MSDLSTPELLDAIVRSLRRTGRRFTRPKKAVAKKAAKGSALTAKSRMRATKSKKRAVRRRSVAARS
jgi:hypothetical protein